MKRIITYCVIVTIVAAFAGVGMSRIESLNRAYKWDMITSESLDQKIGSMQARRLKARELEDARKATAEARRLEEEIDSCERYAFFHAMQSDSEASIAFSRQTEQRPASIFEFRRHSEELFECIVYSLFDGTSPSKEERAMLLQGNSAVITRYFVERDGSVNLDTYNMIDEVTKIARELRSRPGLAAFAMGGVGTLGSAVAFALDR